MRQLPGLAGGKDAGPGGTAMASPPFPRMLERCFTSGSSVVGVSVRSADVSLENRPPGRTVLLSVPPRWSPAVGVSGACGHRGCPGAGPPGEAAGQCDKGPRRWVASGGSWEGRPPCGPAGGGQSRDRQGPGSRKQHLAWVWAAPRSEEGAPITRSTPGRLGEGPSPGA